ncbi:MAG: redox-sensing transcriptional repressor Rex [Clostridia bacterium]|nr:redox-sensing transcriptional repressor Rex [Clostridia bacterium]
MNDKNTTGTEAWNETEETGRIKVAEAGFETPQSREVSKATIARLPLYLRFLQEENSKGKTHIPSEALARSVSVSPVLVRKDLAAVAATPGVPRKGFATVRLIADIEKFLGYDNLSDAIIVGAGGLGKAFLGYEGFKNNGLNIVAAFDCDEKIIGERISDKPVYAMEELESFVQKHMIRIGIIAVPKAAAQSVLDKMVGAGIRAVWNFAPAPLIAPKGVVLKTEDLAASLAILAGELCRVREN